MPPTGTKKSPGRTPKPVGKQKKTTTSSLPPLGPKPTAGKLPQGKLTPGDKRFIGKQAGKLRAARREGVAAATSQLEGIVSGVGKQGRKLTKESNRVIAGMNRLAENEKQFQSRQRRGVEIDTQSILGRTSATGARSGYMDMGVTSGRRRQSVAGAKLSGALTDAAIGQAKGTKKAGQRAFQSIKAAEKQAAGDSMTILDVLAAERKSEDQRFLTEMRYNIRSQRMQQQFQLMMANLGFEQDIYKMRLENRLAADYLEWQNENGYLLKPEEQAALDWKYKKRELDYAYRASNKDKDPAAAAKWHAQNSAVVDAVTQLNTQMTSDEWAAAEEQAIETAEAQGADPAALLYNQVAYKQDSGELPAGVDVSIVNRAVRDMIDNKLSGTLAGNGQSGDGPLYAPNYETIKGYILDADTDGTVTQYVQRHEGQLATAHNNYAMISQAVSAVDAARNTALTDGGFPTGVAVATGAAALGIAAVAGPKGLKAGRAGIQHGTRALGSKVGGAVGSAVGGIGERYGVADDIAEGIGEAVAEQFKGVNADDLLKTVGNGKAANANIAAAAQQGRISPYKTGLTTTAVEVAQMRLAQGLITPAEFEQIRVVSKAVNLGRGAIMALGGPVGDEALQLLRRANPKLYMEITNPWGIVSEEEDEATLSAWELENMQ
jgi:hypothetical protein